MTSRLPCPDFWKGQRVFLTGHTGFKGSWLVLWLRQLGAEVAGFAHAPNGPSLFEAAGCDRDIRSQIGDIRELSTLVDAISAFRPTIVLHLAAQALVRYSYDAPVETYATNVMGVVHILEAVRACDSVRATIIVTSDKCYENREIIWPYREVDRMGGRDPYSNSKGCAELVTASYFSSFFVGGSGGLSSVRAGNVVGGGDWAADRLIPDLVRAFSSQRPALIRSPASIRPWQHVMEPLSGYLLAAETIFGSTQQELQSWNFGPSTEGSAPVREILPIATQAWGAAAQCEVHEDLGARHEAKLLTLDSTKARLELGWRPVWSLAHTIRQTISWYRRFYDGGNARTLTLQQIDEFTDDAHKEGTPE